MFQEKTHLITLKFGNIMSCVFQNEQIFVCPSDTPIAKFIKIMLEIHTPEKTTVFAKYTPVLVLDSVR